jgi:septal ring factor EnvC (AmiA/AmiB activator)
MIDKKRILIIILVFLLFENLSFCSKIKQTQKKLEEVNKTIQQKIQQKKMYETYQKNVAEELKKIEQQIKNLDVEKKNIETKIEQTKNLIDNLKKELELLSTDEEFLSKILRLYLVKYVEQYMLSTPLFEENFYRKIKKDVLKQYILELLQTRDKIYISEKLRQQYDYQKKKLEEYYNELLNKKNQQKELFVKKSEILNTYKKKQQTIEKEIVELQKTQKELECLLEKLKKEEQTKLESKQQIQQVVKIDRKFIKPINGEVVRKFGKQQIAKDGSCVVNNGVVIVGLSNENVVSVDDGVVLFVSNNFRSYGKLVIVEHKDNIHTIYGMLGDILVNEGSKVKKGQVIAKTDSSGQIYFELRKNFIPVDPELYFE